MNLVKRNLFSLPHLSNFLDEDWLSVKPFKQDWPAAINVSENEKNYEVEVIAPGLKKEDFNISVENGVLSVSGETATKNEEENKNYIRKEYSASSFSRSFSLPEGTNEESIAANYNDGILKLTIDKAPTAPGIKKEIAIE